MKKILAASILAAAVLASAALAQEARRIPMIVKVSGIQWFDRMEEGIVQYAEDTGTDAFQLGPTQADAALQVQIIEDMIAQGVDAITVVPFSPEALEPVLARAREEGIVVVTHEAPSQQNVDYDVEAFRNREYGAYLMDQLAACMQEEGEYAVFVGSLTSETHNDWVDGAIERQMEAYPSMTLVGDKNETYDDVSEAADAAREVLRAFPNIKGMQGSASTDVAGIGQVIEERGLEDQTCVMGTSLPSIGGQYIETGAVDAVFFWDPSLAGYVSLKVAEMVLDGETVETGMDLGQSGYESVVVEDKVIYGQAWVTVTLDNLDEFDF
ncbi:MAG: autoinducer 2 ABC transporter substrate-binding protein [Deinococcota bacterium]